MKTQRVPMQLIPPPEDENSLLIAPQGQGIVIRGGGDTGLILECGACGRALSQGVRPRQLMGMIVKCSTCGAYNQVMKWPGSGPSRVLLP